MFNSINQYLNFAILRNLNKYIINYIFILKNEFS